MISNLWFSAQLIGLPHNIKQSYYMYIDSDNASTNQASFYLLYVCANFLITEHLALTKLVAKCAIPVWN